MKLRHALLAFVAGSAFLAGTAYADTISIVAGATGRDLEVLQQELKDFEANSSLSCDDTVVIEGVDQSQMILPGCSGRSVHC